MKIAKASKEDIENAMGLNSFLNSIEDGWMPNESHDDENDSKRFNSDDFDDLKEFHRRVMKFNDRPSGLMRVVWGFATCVDAELFDPEKSYLSVNPKIFETEKELLKSLEEAEQWIARSTGNGETNFRDKLKDVIGKAKLEVKP